MPRGEKPKKPWPAFPLTAHPTGRWCKKVNGKLHYFGPWDDPHGALARWEEQAGTLRRGKPVPIDGDQVPLRTLVNRYLSVRLADANAGAMRWSHYSATRRVVRSFLKHAGPDTPVGSLTPDHFSTYTDKMMGKFKARTIRHRARIIMAVFHHADEEDWISRPVKFGKRFRRAANLRPDPPAGAARTTEEIRVIIQAIDASITTMKAAKERDTSSAEQLLAAVWLAVNGGYGSTDLAELPRDVVDLERAVIDYRRGKTKQERIVPLMPETVTALRPVLARRKGDALVFRTREGHPWRREDPKRDKAGQVTTTLTHDNFGQAYAKVLRKLGMKRKGAAFYELKDAHSELADSSGDVHACMRIVGHALPASRDPYIRVTEERLVAVVNHIRSRLGLPW